MSTAERQRNEREEQRRRVFARDGYRCQQCGCNLNQSDGGIQEWVYPQLAHRIANTKTNRRIYGAEVIDDDDNLVAVCSLRCNNLCNVGFKPMEAQALADRIRSRHEAGGPHTWQS